MSTLGLRLQAPLFKREGLHLDLPLLESRFHNSLIQNNEQLHYCIYVSKTDGIIA